MNEFVEIEEEEYLCCPNCGNEPDPRAIAAYVMGTCDNDDCPVEGWDPYFYQ